MHKKEENWKYDESKKFKDIKSENIKIRDVLPEDAERKYRKYIRHMLQILQYPLKSLFQINWK